MAASSSSLKGKRTSENVASDDVLSEDAEKQLYTHLIRTGKSLLELAYTNEELLQELDKLENLLSKVRQGIKQNKTMKKVLRPAKKALVGLLGHGELDVKIFVTSCLTQLMRITAPNEPLEDDYMKEYFQLAVMACGKLSCMTGHGYLKVLSMLQVFADVHLCVVMWDLELDALLVELFQKFLNTIQSIQLPVVISSMEKIMIMAINSSDEMSLDLLLVLLASVKKENLCLSPFSFKIGERVLEKCAPKLEPYLQEAVSCMGISFGDYANIVASICQGATQRENMDAVKLQVAAASHREVGQLQSSKSQVNKSTSDVRNKRKFDANSTKALHHCDQISKQIDVDETKKVGEDVPVVKKRDGRHSSLLNSEEGYDLSCPPVQNSHSRKRRTRKKVQ
ncbi:sister chromatid cohesion protein pds5-like [Olea europaea var. sylvestris]|uniref:sister chromatid cohesion protein pds5-like n=1 Tax=Olea europaea var. sylvestris TaxID=158386 RepID=UPI000C1CD775|nr:sister chromatid cohesion protein pds5-like [Olea europaea var. sylvestris]XP_022864627.1 sister chromatid cohesion protein pds5-like [Olea europaea var. sylvestris]XP_022864628.1 sister chromatid cohesion protein pds5-like [Olea europaea var. sylvestris]